MQDIEYRKVHRKYAKRRTQGTTVAGSSNSLSDSPSNDSEEDHDTYNHPQISAAKVHETRSLRTQPPIPQPESSFSDSMDNNSINDMEPRVIRRPRKSASMLSLSAFKESAASGMKWRRRAKTKVYDYYDGTEKPHHSDFSDDDDPNPEIQTSKKQLPPHPPPKFRQHRAKTIGTSQPPLFESPFMSPVDHGSSGSGSGSGINLPLSRLESSPVPRESFSHSTSSLVPPSQTFSLTGPRYSRSQSNLSSSSLNNNNDLERGLTPPHHSIYEDMPSRPSGDSNFDSYINNTSDRRQQSKLQSFISKKFSLLAGH